MSDTPQGPGWWQASDGRWYPPEQLPGPRPQWYGPNAAPPRNDSLAVTAFVFALAGIPIGFVCGIGFVLPVAAIPMGIIARGRIRDSDGALTGSGMAVAAIVIGSVLTALMILAVVLFVVLLASWGESSGY